LQPCIELRGSPITKTAVHQPPSPPAAPPLPPNHAIAQTAWQPVKGASHYVVSAYDAYSGRSLGINYQTNQNGINIAGLPLGQPIQLVVQVRVGVARAPSRVLAEAKHSMDAIHPIK
jgi:hypothetical protein